MSDKTPKERLLDALKDLPRLSFSPRQARNPDEGADRSVVWGAKSLDEVVKTADRRFDVKSRGKGHAPR